MKNYTNIEQSNKLVKILSPESADMVYCYTKKEDKLVYPIPSYLTGTLTNTFKYLYCWSLAALLEIIPYRLNDGSDFTIEKWEDGYLATYGTSCHKYGNELIDVCYEMILELHEQKLL